MSVIEGVGRCGGVDGGQWGGRGDHWQRSDHRLGFVGDGHRCGCVVHDGAEGGVRVSLDGAVREVSADAL